jgi:hypothetical protein
MVQHEQVVSLHCNLDENTRHLPCIPSFNIHNNVDIAGADDDLTRGREPALQPA